MTYYYDSEARVLLSVDPETEDVRILEPIDFEEDEPALKTVKVKPVPQSARTTGRGCPECGSPGRHKKDCFRSANIKAKPAKQRAPGQGCPECGSKSRHRKECSHAGGATKSNTVGNKAWKNLGEVSSAKPGMSQMQFGRVKIAQSHDIPAETIAKNMDLSESQVSKALDVETFDDYLNL
jgi:hypothetical protein